MNNQEPAFETHPNSGRLHSGVRKYYDANFGAFSLPTVFRVTATPMEFSTPPRFLNDFFQLARFC